MLQKNNIQWNNDFQYDGLIYFAQRIVEMLDFNTVDIYRAPLFNTTRLIAEYLSVYNGYAKAYHLEEIYHEFMDSFENDIIIQYKLDNKRIQQIIKALNKDDNRLQIMSYLQHTICSQYLEWTKEYLLYIVPQNKKKGKIERAIQCLIPELLNCGYSRDEIYHSSLEILTSSNPNEALQQFLNRYNTKELKYTVYLAISNNLVAFKDVLEQRLNICFDDDGNFNKLEIQGNYTIVKKSEITAVDASSAANTAFHDIELFAMFYQYFGNYSKNLISNKALAIDENFNERKLVVNRGKYKTIESDNSTGIGDLSESIITQLINNAYYTMPQLMRIIKLHNRAISNNGLENGFLNLWSILEITCVKDPDKSKIDQIIKLLIPILQRDYLPTIFQDIRDSLKKVLSHRQYEELLSEITEGEDALDKIACLILLEKYKEKLDSFVDCLITYPVLRSRMLNLHDEYSSCRKGMYNLTQRYAKRLSWHLYRIYRARNSIVHNGTRPNDLKDLGEHLHLYIDRILNEIIIKLSRGSLSHVSNVFVDTELQLQQINDYLKADEPFNIEGIHLMVSSNLECWYEETPGNQCNQ